MKLHRLPAAIFEEQPGVQTPHSGHPHPGWSFDYGVMVLYQPIIQLLCTVSRATVPPVLLEQH